MGLSRMAATIQILTYLSLPRPECLNWSLNLFDVGNQDVIRFGDFLDGENKKELSRISRGIQDRSGLSWIGSDYPASI